MEQKGLELEHILSLAVSDMNSNTGTRGLSPCLLVFGISPKLPTEGKDYPEQRKRFKALQFARSTMLKVTDRQRLAKALRLNAPMATDHEISIGSDVLLYKERPRNEWVGLYRVMAGDNENLLLNIDGRVVPASVEKVKPYRAKAFPRFNNPSSTSLDQVLGKFIAGKSFFVELCVGISKALNTSNEEYINPVRPNEMHAR